MVNGHLQVFYDDESLYQAVGRYWQAAAEDAVRERGSFHVALAGGNTPKGLYQCLAQANWCERLPWQQTHVYFGDERCVPQDHPDSNYNMARQALLMHVPLPPMQVYPMYDPAHNVYYNAEAYDSLLRQRLPGAVNKQPAFDLILLGLGPDGHTASLFPGTAILEENQRVAAAVYVESKEAWRISLTIPAINAARKVAVLVTGTGKAEIMHAIETAQEAHFPVQCIDPEGQLDWFVDREAASLMSGRGAR